jgi:hypothetical protein
MSTMHLGLEMTYCWQDNLFEINIQQCYLLITLE